MNAATGLAPNDRQRSDAPAGSSVAGGDELALQEDSEAVGLIAPASALNLQPLTLLQALRRLVRVVARPPDAPRLRNAQRL